MEKNKIDLDIAVKNFIAQVKIDPSAFITHVENKRVTIPRSKEEMAIIKKHLKMKVKDARLSISNS
jgi:hypothetical protein